MSAEAMAEGEVDYESDPEEAGLSLKMRRRRGASDDEEEGEDGGGDRREKPVRRIDSDVESDGQGGAADYEDELDDEEYYDEDGEYVDEDIDDGEEGVEDVDGVDRPDGVEERDMVKLEGPEEGRVVGESMEQKRGLENEAGENDSRANDGQQEDEKKEVEPYSVPTTGAFYMHDDRFRDNAGGRHRRTLGGRKLWESRDDRKWGHDKFEELTVQDRHHEERRRTSRGRYRGRGRSRGAGRGPAQGNRSKAYNNNNNRNNDNNQVVSSKGFRGRGPQRYQPTSNNNNNEAPPTRHNRQGGRSMEKPSRFTSGRTSSHMPNVEPDNTPQPRKQVFASNLSITSPPFYPSGAASTKEPQKRDTQAGHVTRDVPSSGADESLSVPQSSAMLRGKNIVNPIGMDKLYISDQVSNKALNAVQMPLSGSLSMNSNQLPLMRSQGRGIASSTEMAYQPIGSNNQVSRVPQSLHLQSFQRNSGQNRGQSLPQGSGQGYGQRLPVGSQGSPPKAGLPVNSFEASSTQSPPDASKSNTALLPKGRGGIQGGGRGSFLYGGSQVIGASGSSHGDQNFPTFLPVMQFGGQHQGGIPAIGMAFPGYVGPNNEMTWLPVLTGAAGALGAGYSSPYLTVDGSYHARPSAQTSSVAASLGKESNTTRDGNDWKPSQRPEPKADDFGQRQKNPRRYTEMKFDQ